MKIKLLALILGMASVSFSQSLSIENADSSKAVGDAYTAIDLETHINIRNNSSQTLDVGCKRIDKNYNQLTDDNAICWVACYSTSVSVSPQTIIIGAGQVTGGTDTFIGHVYPDGDGVNRKGAITYVWYDVNNPTDSVAYTVNYEVTGGIGLNEETFDQFSVYPNPATSKLNIKYAGMKGGNTSFELVNMVGNRVYSKQLESKNAELKLDISNLPRGVYFYIVKSDGQVSSSKKLVIK